jgi:site-specific recombinase XerD
MMTPLVPICLHIAPASLIASQFQTLTEVLPEIEGFANLTNPNTCRTYQHGIQDFVAFSSLRMPEQFHDATRAHVIACRDHSVRQEPANGTIRRKLEAQPSFYAYLCERHTVLYNLMLGGQARALDEPGRHVARAY